MLHRATVLPATLGLLSDIMAKPALSGFYLVGGTSLALQIGHRVSVDLDFFGNRPFEALEILDELSDLAPVSIMSQRDFYDLYFLLQQYSLEELMGFYLRKFEDGSEFMVARSLVYSGDGVGTR